MRIAFNARLTPVDLPYLRTFTIIKNMATTFYKYQGTGNDFVMIDNRGEAVFKKDTKLIKQLCDRRFGIGGDGLILLEDDIEYDFRMVYYNSDGNESSMCGNGGRCIVAFAKQLGVIENKCRFIAADGPHEAYFSADGLISVRMKDVDTISVSDDHVFLDTGSPHHVTMVDDLKSVDVKTQGSKIRYSELYGKVGSNINFVEQKSDDIFSVRTYERGVEDETLSCGTGVTAVAIAMNVIGKTKSTSVKLCVEGGELAVAFVSSGTSFTEVWLTGPANYVFSGEIEL